MISYNLYNKFYNFIKDWFRINCIVRTLYYTPPNLTKLETLKFRTGFCKEMLEELSWNEGE